jgi:capsular exopolysaccharide synthesis family protein
MSIKQYFALLRRRAVFIAGSVAVGVVVLGVLAWTRSPVYSATTKLFVSTGGEQDSLSQSFQSAQFGQLRVKSYADIVSSPPVVSAVKQQLRLPDSVRDLAKEISASTPLNTVLIEVTVKDGDAVRARDIANAASDHFTQVVSTLETPTGATTSPIKVSVIEPANLPSSPSSPNRTLYLTLGALLGLAAGIGGAVLRETLDNSVRSKDGAEEAAVAPVLGAIGEDEKAASRPLVVQDDQFSAGAEAFRQLRTNIQFLSLEGQVRSLVVTGSVAAEGKTTTASNLALALAQAGDRVILVDADLRRPTLAPLLGLNPKVGLTNVLLGKATLHEALQPWRDDLPLQVLTSGPKPPNPSELLGGSRMADLLDKLKGEADVVVFDSPPLLPVTDAAALARLTDGAVVVCQFGRTKTDHLAQSAESLRSVGATVLGVVLNRVSRRRSDSYEMLEYTYPDLGSEQSSQPLAEVG